MVPGEDFPKWVLWLGTTGPRWALFALELLGVTILIATVVMAMVGGWHWTRFLTAGVGLIVCCSLFWFASALHPLAAHVSHEFHVAREARLSKEDTRGYFLFLRSFGDNSFAIRQTMMTEGNSATILLDNLSELLEHGLEGYGRFIMIGEEPSADWIWDPTAIAHSNDDNWWNMFQRLLANARCVFIVPESSPGLLREIKEALSERYQNKIVIIMPPQDTEGRRGRRWDELRKELRQEELNLPIYNPIGCFYIPDSRLFPIRTFPFSIVYSVPWAMRRAFRRIAPTLPSNTTSLREALTWIESAKG